MLAASVRALLETFSGRAAHSVYEAEKTGHSAASVQRGAGADTARAGRHPAGREPLQAAELQGLRRAVPGLHHGQVRLVPDGTGPPGDRQPAPACPGRCLDTSHQRWAHFVFILML